MDSLLPMIKYPGGKSVVASKIINRFPSEYDIFVEPFIGGRSIYFRETKAKTRVINDKSRELVNFYRQFRDSPCDDIQKLNANIQSKSKFKKVCNARTESPGNYLISSAKSFTGFCENGMNYKSPKLSHVKQNCEKYKEKLRNTVILNKDWKEVVRKYDSPKTLQYIDPPYSKKSFKYREEGVTPKEVCDVVKKLKSKVILSYDNSAEVRKACNGLKFNYLNFCYGMTMKSLGHCKPKKELLITNF